MQDREEVLSKSKLLKTANIYVSEDLSRKTREHRNELFKYMRFVKRRAPNRKCVIRYDKLFVDNDCFVFDEAEGRVVRWMIVFFWFCVDFHHSDTWRRQLPLTTAGRILDKEQGEADG